jgi:hypothetical protein
MIGDFYGNAFVAAFNGEIDFDSGDVKVALLEDAHTPNLDAHNYFDDVVADEVSGTGYTAGGQVLGTPSVTYNTGTNTLVLDGDNASWGSSTISAAYAVVYLDTGVDATSPLIGLVDFETIISSTDGTFSVNWDAAGIATVTVT